MEFKLRPVCFSLKQRAVRSKKITQKISEELSIKTENFFFDFNDVYPVIAKKGSLIVSYQFGIHRGAEADNGFRSVLTFNCGVI